MTETGFGVGGRREVTVGRAMTSRARLMKVQTRMAQSNPSEFNKCSGQMGMATPPILVPVSRMPNAKARFLWNQVLAVLSDAVNSAASPSEVHTPAYS